MLTESEQLADKWKEEIRVNGPMLDVTTWISRLMLDNIGEGNYLSPVDIVIPSLILL